MASHKNKLTFKLLENIAKKVENLQADIPDSLIEKIKESKYIEFYEDENGNIFEVDTRNIVKDEFGNSYLIDEFPSEDVFYNNNLIEIQSFNNSKIPIKIELN